MLMSIDVVAKHQIEVKAQLNKASQELVLKSQGWKTKPY